MDERIIKPERRSTLARLQQSVGHLTTTMNNVKKGILVSTILTAAFCGAVFGITLTANEMSKDTTVSAHSMLVDSVTQQPISVMPYKTSKNLNHWSTEELKDLQHLQYVDTDGFTNFIAVNGIVYKPEDTDNDVDRLVMFLTNSGKFGLNSDGSLSRVYENDTTDLLIEDEESQIISVDNESVDESFEDETPGRSLLAGTGGRTCMKSCVGRRTCWYFPPGCNDSSISDGVGQTQCSGCSDPDGSSGQGEGSGRPEKGSNRRRSSF